METDTFEQHMPDTKKPIRVFVLDDQEPTRIGLKELIDLNPERDMVHVGEAEANTADLIKQIGEKRPDVIIVDLLLGGSFEGPAKEIITDPLRSGLKAIRQIKAEFGSQIKILAYSNYPEWRRDALKSGADEFRFKGIPTDEFRAAIRALMGAEPPPPRDIGIPTGLDLICEEYEFFVKVIGTGETPRRRLHGGEFAFLTLLAAGRLKGIDMPVKRTGPQSFEPADALLWNNVKKAIFPDAASKAESFHAPGWRVRVNSSVESFLPLKAGLVLGPGPRGLDGYTLTPSIERSRIRLIGFPTWFTDFIHHS